MVGWGRECELQQICQINLSNFNEIAGMRLITTLILAVILSAALTVAAVIQQPSSTTSPSPNSKSPLQNKPNCTLTFQQFKIKYSKHYSTVAEQSYRQHIYYSNRRKLNSHNNDPTRTYNMKPNSFLDVSQDEFKSLYTGTRPSTEQSRNLSHQIIRKNRQERCGKTIDCKNSSHRNSSVSVDALAINSSLTVADVQIDNSAQVENSAGNDTESDDAIRNLQGIGNLTTSLQRIIVANQNYSQKDLQIQEEIHSHITAINVDWSLYSGHIKFQGLCGACYAFSTVDTLSTLNAINKFGFFIPLSVQQVVDCVDNGLTFGCNGGFLEGAFTYIQMRGISTQHSYPYTSQKSGKPNHCKFEGGPFKISAFSPITEGDCLTIIAQLDHGPVSAGISGFNLQFYDSGVFNECSDVLDHAIMIVGYKSGVGWKIKNSWGTEWGEEGYGWIDEGNTCGICNMAVTVDV